MFSRGAGGGEGGRRKHELVMTWPRRSAPSPSAARIKSQRPLREILGSGFGLTGDSCCVASALWIAHPAMISKV